MPGPKILIDFSTVLAALGIDARGPVEFRPELAELVGVQVKLLDLTRLRRPVLQPRSLLSSGTIAAGGAGTAGILLYTPPRGCYVIGASVINEGILGETDAPPTPTTASSGFKTDGELGAFGEAPIRGYVPLGSLQGFTLRGAQNVDGMTLWAGETSPLLWVGPGRTVYLCDAVGNVSCRMSLAILEPYAT